MDSKTLARGDAWEKHTEDVNLRQTSPTSPDWMQVSNKIPHDARAADLKPKGVFGQHTRIEQNRVILFDSKQPLLNGNH